MKHKPIIDSDGVYQKTETDDNCIYRKGQEGPSLSIRASVLEKSESVRVDIVHRGVTVFATKEQIKAHKEVRTFHGEVKYYLPIKKWKVVAGDTEWVSKL